MAISQFYGLALQSLAEGRIDWVDGNVKAALLNATYAPDPSDKFYADLSGEITGTGYTVGGVAVTDTEAVFITETGRVRWTCANPSWTGTFTARYLVFYCEDADNPTDKPLISYVDFETNQVVDGESFVYQVPTRGIVEFLR